ncbi:DUF5655 domain-containing protein [Pedobacter punctiformis]|uniref:DUF5655 domain-containing protein n=1 Tax=Pedobacter punctiformis TaxID=3004097 RepID=A0ABT4L7B8_9SPHI|nr:DUF5655 domain-containing protein [Pedobacter sp. HCMS5-2]MCZ4243814.1 DUF5655 domain-containing protein [Pedobacter sp. HCMS5-2]
MSEGLDLSGLLNGKTEYALSLFRFFITEFEKVGKINLQSTKSMIAIEGLHKMAYLTQVGKNFIHVVFQFDRPYEDNLCFIKIAQVPNTNQFNHHLRIYFKEDINDEVKSFMKMAYSYKNN